MEKKYRIYLQGQLVEVEEAVYLAYHQMRRQEKTLYEKDKRNNVMLYSNMDTDEILGAEMVPDLHNQSTEDKAVTLYMAAKLQCAIQILSESEKELIVALYYNRMTEREYAKMTGLSQKAINKQRDKILNKLKTFLK